MVISEVVEALKELCPNTRIVDVWDEGTREDTTPFPPCWHIYTYKEGKGIETVITETLLPKLTKRQVETSGRAINRAFSSYVN